MFAYVQGIGALLIYLEVLWLLGSFSGLIELETGVFCAAEIEIWLVVVKVAWMRQCIYTGDENESASGPLLLCWAHSPSPVLEAMENVN